MVVKTDHFQANGIPVTPVDDSGAWNPYQVAEITVKNSSGAVIAKTQTTIPTSDEINCGKCHGSPGASITQVFTDILTTHDTNEGTALVNQVQVAKVPVLCASCHSSPALGGPTPGPSDPPLPHKYLSEAIHGFHAGVTSPPVCYDCHPGNNTKCSRSLKNTNPDGNCASCHGSLSNVASTITANNRIPWVNESMCAGCHQSSSAATLTAVSNSPVRNIPEVNTGSTLYRDARGHGGVYCASCHQSPHAMVPTNRASDNYQAMQYQNSPKTIGSCVACHICHTAISNDQAQWPHKFQWKAR